MTFTHFPHFIVEGSNYDIGYAIGEHFLHNITQTLLQSARFQHLWSRDQKNPAIADQALKLIENHFPQYLQEIKGIADGASQNFRSILLMNLMHLYDDENCSTLVIKTPDRILLGHNEDLHKVLVDNSYYLTIKLHDGSQIFTHAYPGCIPGFSHGSNSHGIVITCNYVPDPVKAIGIPRTILGRWMLESTSIQDAIDRAVKFSPRSGGVSYNIVSLKEHRAVNLEITGNDHAITEIQDVYYRTNHYISKKLSFIDIPSDKISTTRIRYERGCELLPHVSPTPSAMLKLLWDDNVFIKGKLEPHNVIHMTMNTTLFDMNSDINIKIYPRNRDETVFDSFNF